jgi:hypothetical protein
MDELRQRLERVLNDPPSPIQSLSSPVPSQQSSISMERHSCLPVSKSFRLPIQPVPIQVQSSAGYRSIPLSRVPLKSTSSSLSSTQTNHSIPSLIKGTSRGPTLITPPRLKPTTHTQCLSSTENLRTTNNTNPIPAITVGSTPLPRKQLPSIQIPNRNLSYRTTNNSTTSGYQSHYTNGNYQQQMSKSFIMPSKRDGKLEFQFHKIIFLFLLMAHRSSKC